MRNGILLLCALTVAAGCTQNKARPGAAKPAAVTASTPEAAWQNRQRVFARMKAWSMKGRVGLQLRGQSWSFGMNWAEKAGGESVMDIINPLTGAVMANIRETGSQVVLKAADGKSYRDTDAERLLQRQLKLRFPLNDMRYWARGIPAPNQPIESVKLDAKAVKLDAKGRPLKLQQGGWVVTYTAFKGNGTNAFPAKMTLEKAAERAKAKVVAKQWRSRF